MEICENCYDEVVSVFNVKGVCVCKSCISDMKANAEPEDMSFDEPLLDNFADMPGVMSDNDVIDMIRSEYVDY